MLAFELKLYPIFGLMVLLRKKAVIFFGLMLAAFAYVSFRAITNMDELSLIAATAPRKMYASFGIYIFSQSIASHGPLASLLTLLLSCTIVAAAVILSFRALLYNEPGFLGETDSDPKRLDAFRMGSAIYVGTFLIGNNYDYRLLFLILTIPQLLDWRHHGSKIVPRISTGVLAAIYMALWHFPITALSTLIPHGWQMAFFVDQACHYIICCGLIYLCVLSVPAEMAGGIRRIRRRSDGGH
jgi:hypothetical protein